MGRGFLVVVAVAALVVAGSNLLASRAYSAPADLMQPGPLGEQALGAENAPNVVIEYASMTCGHCALFAKDVLPLLKRRDIDTGKVRFIFREFPLDVTAVGASMLARCAGKEKFFPTVELLFRTRDTWAVQKPLGPLLETVKRVGFTDESFKTCLADQRTLDGVLWVREYAAKNFKVNAAPTFFVNGEMKSFVSTIEQIEALLRPGAAVPAK